MPTTLQPEGVSNETPGSITPPQEAGFEGLEEVKPAAVVEEPGFEGLTPVTNETGEDVGFEGLPEADRLDLEDEKSLVDDDSFRPAEVMAANPNLQNQGGNRWQKLINIYRAKRVRGLETGKVLKAAVTEAPGVIAKTVKGAGQLASRTVDIAINPLVNEVLGFAEYFATRGKSSPSKLREETRNRQLKAAAEIGAGTESAMTGITQLGTEGARKLFGKAPAEQTDNELYDQLLVDAEFHKATRDAFSGEGDFVKATGLNASFLDKNGITLDKSAIENLSLVDPLTLVATAGVFKVVTTGGKILATAATRAGAQAVINGLSKVATTAATKGLNVAGRVTAATGRAVQRLPLRQASAGAVGAQVISGNVPGAIASAVAPTAVRATGRVLERAGTLAAEAGEQLRPGFVGPRTAGVTRLAEMAASAPVRVAKTAATGAVAGAAASAPLALASQDSQTAGAILGGGTALGTTAGLAVGGKNALANSVAKRYLDPHSIPFEAVESKGYGVEPGLDTAHEAAIQNLPSPEQNAINTFREAVRDRGGEIYVQDSANYLERIRESLREEKGVQQLSPEDEALAQNYADTHATLDTFRTGADGQQRRIVFLNESAKGLPHDAGHLFQSLMSPERQAQLREAVFDSYTPEQLNEFANGYVERLGEPDYFQKLGPEAGRAKVADEIIAENFSQLFGNTNIADLKAPPKFLDTLARTAVEAGETLGLDLTSGRKTADLGVSPAYRLQNLLRNASREVLTAEKKPGAVPRAEEIAPVTPEEPVSITPDEVKPASESSPAGETPAPTEKSAARAQETGIETAKLLTEEQPEARATVDQISASMEAGNPALRIEHRGITAEPAGAPRQAGRTSRRGTQEAGYAELERLQIENRKDAPASVVDVHEKTFVPVRWVEQGGKATLIAMSSDKVIGNIRRIVADANSKGAADLIPYENADGKLTEAGWTQAMNDFRAYADNQSHGYRGDGQKLVRPSEEAKVSIPAEDPNFSPTQIDEAKANFLNMIQGLAPPKTARAIKGQVPGNVKAQMVAEANLRQPQPVAKVSPADLKKQSFPAPFQGRTVMETNPLRNELQARGVNTRNLLEVTERFAAEDIASVNPAAPEAQFKAPVTDVIRGGFLPKEQDAARRAGFLPDAKPSEPIPSAEIRDLAANYAKKAGIDYRPSRDYAGIPSELGKELADLLDAAQSNPDDPAVQASYRALANEVLNQYKAMVDAGYKIEPFKGEGEPYKSSAEAVADIRNNKHLYFLKTEGAFGSGPDIYSTNPMLNDSGVVINGERLMVNDVFRAVHDFFGHGKEGYQFGPRGEFNAWRSHSEMFSPEAQGALAAETLAQNAWVNFGKHLRNADGSLPQKGEPGYIPAQNRPFAPQKNFVVPDTMLQRARQAAGERKFLPEGKSVEEFGRELLDAPATAFKPAMDALGGLTNGAWDLGAGLKRPEDVAVLQNLATEASAKAKQLMQAGDFTEAMPTVMKAQFFREAYEAATGTASVKTEMENGRMPAGYKPPFPEGGAPTAGAQGEMGRLFLPAEEIAVDLDPIKMAAIRTKGGHVVTGSWHGEAYTNLADQFARGEVKEPLPEGFKSLTELLDDVAEVGGPSGFIEDGFVTQSGKFLNRVEALEHAEKINQLRDNANPGKFSGRQAGVLESAEFNRDRSFLPSDKEVTDALSADKKPFVGAARELEAGTPVGLRIDIPAFTRHGVYVITVHEKAKGGQVGKRIGYDSVATVDNPTFFSNEKGAEKIRGGAAKFPIATVEGEFNPSREVPTDLSDWTVVGYNPTKHSYFYDKSNDRPVTGGDQAISAGNSVYVKNPVYGDAGDFAFLPKERKASVKAGDLTKVERDEKGRPLTAEGLIDYETLYKEKAASEKVREAESMKELEAKVAAGKYSVEPSQRPKSGQLTGWLLPNDEFVPLDTAFHEEWLGKNSKRLNEDFGTNFGDKVTPEQRFDAVNKGFVRVRYTPNDGTVRIEASAKNWTPNTRRKLMEQLEQHADSIDRVYAAVMDEKGNLIDSASERVMDLEGPEKVEAFQSTLDGLNAGTTERAAVEPGMIRRAREGFGEPAAGSEITELGPKQRAFLPKQGTKEFDAYVRERIKESKQFPEAIPLEGVKDNEGHYRTQYGDEPLFVTEPWDFNDSPLANENRGKTVAESEELYTDALAKKLEEAYAEAKKNPEVEAGETWYSVAREKIQSLLGDDAQFFAELLGATSPNTAVDVNFGYAVEAYNLYKQGYYDKLIEKYREGKQAFRAGELEEFSKETGKTGKKATEKAFLTWWSEKHNLEPTSNRTNPKTGQPIKFGFHTQPVMRVLDRSWLQQVEGPKTPNFTGNLSGATFQATIDVWAARLLRRLSWEGLSDKPWRIHSIAEQGVGERDFFTGQKAFRKAADELGIQPDALQAILWFAEKNHWEKNGWTRAAGAKKADYNVLLQTATKTPEGQLQYTKVSAKKPAKAKVDNQPELPNID